MTADDVIRALDLQPLPGEGGYFRQTWISHERQASGKAAGTAIYYLVTDAPDGFSALHRLPTDEVYHFYLGDPAEQLLLFPDGRSEVVVLGPDLASGHRVQHVAPRHVWQGTRLAPAEAPRAGRWALLGTTMAPGFEAGDYEAGDRTALLVAFPAAAALIRVLTREP